MQGYNQWRKQNAWFYGKLNERHNRHDTHRARHDLDDGDGGYDSDEMGRHDSYDYTQHVVGNTAAQRQVDLAHQAAPPVTAADDDDSYWDDLWLDEEERLAFVKPSQPQRPVSLHELVMSSLARKLQERQQRLQQRNARRAPRGGPEANALLEQLEGLGFGTGELRSAGVVALRQILDAARDKTRFDADAYAEKWRLTSAGDDDDGMGTRQLTATAEAPERGVHGPPSAALLLPCEVWTNIGGFFRSLLPVVRLSSSCTYFRDLLEDTDCFRDKWANTVVPMHRPELYSFDKLWYRSVIFKTSSSAGAARIPPREYRWSWHLSLRRHVLQEHARLRFYNLNNLSHGFNEVCNALRVCDANAWFQLFLQTVDPAARAYAQMQVNRHVGMANIACDQAERFFGEHDQGASLPELLRRQLRVPSTPRAVEELLSSIRLASLSSVRENECDAALEAEQALGDGDGSDGGHAAVPDDCSLEWEDGAQLTYNEVRLHATVLGLKGGDVVNSIECMKQQPEKGVRKFYHSRRRYIARATRRKIATASQNRVRKQLDNIAVENRGMAHRNHGQSNQEYGYACSIKTRRRTAMQDIEWKEPAPAKPGCLPKNRRTGGGKVW